ncbi:MAG TPA: retropepsin-like aspartic protease, partial [Acidiferrobacteraceae bacterium]|nr:retropepsin-like aspartic protease [Acidiferrobacteraceae bacterium]
AALALGQDVAPGAAAALARIALLENDLDTAGGWLARAADQGTPAAALAPWALEYALRRRDFAAAAQAAANGGDPAAAAYWDQLAGLQTYRIEGAPCVAPLACTDPLPVLEVRINGVAARLLVDTAADHVLLDQDLAPRVRAMSAGVGNPALFAGGARTLQNGWVETLELAGWSLGAVPVQILSLRALFQEFAGAAIDGVLGMRVLSLFRLRLDYRVGTLELLRRPAATLSAGRPLWLGPGGLPLTGMILNGHYAALGLLDSGCMGLALAARAAVLHPATRQQALAAGGGGLTAVAPTTLRRLEAAGAVQEDAPAAALADFPLAHRFGFCVDGLIGHLFLRQGALELDFDCMRVLLDSSRDKQALSPARNQGEGGR